MKTRYKIILPIITSVTVFVFFQTWILADCISEGGEPRFLSCEWVFAGSVTPQTSTLEKELDKKIQVMFEERLSGGLAPITVTEITNNAESLDEILVWNFRPMGYAANNIHVAWDSLPEEHRISYNIVNDESQDIGDYDRKEFIYLPFDLHAYRMDCGIFQTVSGESAHPTSFPIKNGTQTVFAQNSRIGIYPDSEGKYSLEFASIFPHYIMFPENSTETITYDSKECKLLHDIEDVKGEYEKGYYTKITFRYLEK